MEVAPSNSVPVIAPKLAYNIIGGTQEVYDVSSKTENFVMTPSYRGVTGTREGSCMCFRGIYRVQADQNALSAVYYCMFNKCRSAKSVVPGARKQSINVNKHYRTLGTASDT